MANIDDILSKSKAKLTQQGLQKKIKRDGPKRPWQEGLLEINSAASNSNETKTSNKLVTENVSTFDFNLDPVQIVVSNNLETHKKENCLNKKNISEDIVISDDISKNLHLDTNDFNYGLNEPIATTLNDELRPMSDTHFSSHEHLNSSTENLQQTYNKLTTQPTTVVQQNLQQFRNKHTTNIQQTYNNKTETYNKLTTQPTTVVQQEPTTVVQQNLQQFRNKHTTNIQQTYNKLGVVRLSGISLNILNSFFSICISNGNRITGPVSIETITSLSKTNGSKVAQTIIYRLEKDGYIKRDSFKSGRGGWTSYEIPTEIYNQLLQLTTKPTTIVQQNLQQTYNESTTQPTTQLTTTPSSKLVSKNINNTNYLSKAEVTLSIDNPTPLVSKVQPTWFKELDFSSVSPISPMQVNSSIRNLVQEKLEPEQVQEFLNRFKSWLATQQKIQNPLAIFCDRLKEFATEGDSAILSVMTDHEREIEAKFLEETQKARTQMQLISRANQEKLRSQQEIAKLEAEDEFEKWYASASDSELAQIVLPSDLMPLRSGLHKIATKSAFMIKLALLEE